MCFLSTKGVGFPHLPELQRVCLRRILSPIDEKVCSTHTHLSLKSGSRQAYFLNGPHNVLSAFVFYLPLFISHRHEAGERCSLPAWNEQFVVSPF